MPHFTAPRLKKLQAANRSGGYARKEPVTCLTPSYWERAGQRTVKVSEALRAQRVGILDHIGAAAGRGAGGEQHEALRRKNPAGKIAAHRQVIRDVLAR